jgi:hypothetical protein
LRPFDKYLRRPLSINACLLLLKKPPAGSAPFIKKLYKKLLPWRCEKQGKRFDNLIKQAERFDSRQLEKR